MSSNPDDRATLAAFVRAMTVVGAEIAFAGLFAYAIYTTWNAAPGHVPAISKPIESAAGALAVALGGGYAAYLGLQPEAGVRAVDWIKSLGSVQLFLFTGVLVYMATGAACGLTYLAHTEEVPGLIKTMAIGFGGYVIAYLGAAYRQLTQ